MNIFSNILLLFNLNSVENLWNKFFLGKNSYIPHGHCYLWQTPLVSLHVISDALIAIAYFSIPVMLVYFAYQRRNILPTNIFIMFGAFIVLCGVGHLLDIWTLWHPAYWLEGLEDALTALVSCYTALSLVTLLPQFLALRSPEELEIINAQLQVEVQERQAVSEKLKTLNQQLEQLIAERTQELQLKNSELQAEIRERQLIQAEIVQRSALDRLLSRTLQQVGQLSIDQSTVLQNITHEIRAFLNVDRVLIYQFTEDWHGFVTTESIQDPSLSLINQVFPDPCFQEQKASFYQAGNIKAIENIHNIGLKECYREFLEELQVVSMLVIPILWSSDKYLQLSLSTDPDSQQQHQSTTQSNTPFQTISEFPELNHQAAATIQITTGSIDAVTTSMQTSVQIPLQMNGNLNPQAITPETSPETPPETSPILRNETNFDLWGLLIAHHCQAPRSWQPFEIETLQRLSTQLGIAIQKIKLIQRLTYSEQESRFKAESLSQALEQLKATQMQLVQSEKMAALGQMVAGVAHEINNPLSFIRGNLHHISGYTQDLLDTINFYEKHAEITSDILLEELEEIDLEFVRDDFPKLLKSMQYGADRIRDIVISLRNFSRLDESERKSVQVLDGLESALNLLRERLKQPQYGSEIQLKMKYDATLPELECYPSLLNQAFFNILFNAIEALESRLQLETNFQPILSIRTSLSAQKSPQQVTFPVTDTSEIVSYIVIEISDNGIEVPIDNHTRIFDPFFTTKPIGQGVGLGLSQAYQIIKTQHKGELSFKLNSYGEKVFSIMLPLT